MEATTALATTSPEHAAASIAAFILVVIFYLVPAFIALGRSANRKWGIVALNIFLGWTGLGWIGAFIWSVSARSVRGEGDDRMLV